MLSPAAISLAQLLAGSDAAPALRMAGADNAISRAQLRDAAAAAARHLRSLGFARGDALAVWVPNGPAWLQLLLAAAEIGVLVVPISTRYKAPEVRHLLNVSRARGIVAPTRFLESDYAAVARGLKAEVETLEMVLELDDVDAFLPWSGAADGKGGRGEGADPLCCFSTSGTTGFPKLAVHGHASIARHAHYVAQALDIRPGDATLCVLPLFGVFGFMAALGTLAGGGCCVFVPVFDNDEAVAMIPRHRITHVIGADSMFDAMLKVEGADYSTWRRGVLADFVGLPPQVTRRGDQFGIRFSGTYGSSECYALMSFHDWNADAAQRAKSGGVPADPAISVRVVDPETGAELGDGEAGEIQVRGPNVLAGYLNNPEATARAMTPDGWFRSGDLGHRDGPGFVYLARMGDSLRLRGFLVNPAEIENCLMEHASVGGAQVVGVRREGEGDVAVAYVVAGAGVPDEAVLLAHCRERMASYKLPRRVIVIDEFPAINGPNGNKIQKRVLREMAAAALG